MKKILILICAFWAISKAESKIIDWISLNFGSDRVGLL